MILLYIKLETIFIGIEFHDEHSRCSSLKYLIGYCVQKYRGQFVDHWFRLFVTNSFHVIVSLARKEKTRDIFLPPNASKFLYFVVCHRFVI